VNQIRENIALGNPTFAHDTELIERAAELGGCVDIINRFPEKLDAFLQMPVHNCFSRMPVGTSSVFGTKNIHRFNNRFAQAFQDSQALSGGEQQRLAL
jgi:ABC-type multidrug transport system fused ATPase/permease subunit